MKQTVWVLALVFIAGGCEGSGKSETDAWLLGAEVAGLRAENRVLAEASRVLDEEWWRLFYDIEDLLKENAALKDRAIDREKSAVEKLRRVLGEEKE